MIKNYVKVAWRNIQKSKWYSFINVAGLGTGMAVALLIGLWIWDELSFNKNHRNYDRIAQLMTTQTFNGVVGTGPAVSMAMGIELRTKHTSDFKYVTLSSWNFDHLLAAGEKKLTTAGLWTQAEFPRMMSLKILKGKGDGLKDPSSMLVSQTVATALFGNDNPIDKTVRLDNKADMKIVGVYEDIPRSSTFYETKILLPWDKYVTLEPWLKEAPTQWGNHSWQTFVQVNENVEFDKVTAKIKDIPKQHVKEGKEEVLLHPMRQWHLFREFKNGKVVGGRIQFVWLFGIIGVFVLLLACINFMNLSTARSEKRAKEVGIRKTLGSLRRQLMGQFLSESLMTTLFSFVLSIGIVVLLLPFFNGLADKQMVIPWTNPMFWLITLVFTFFTGLVSGSYPAFYLSGFEPIKVLKGTFRAGRFAALPRKILVVVQFTVSVTLIIGTIIVYKQIQFAKNRPVGYTREGLIEVGMNTPDLFGKYNVLRSELLATGVLADMAQSSSPITSVWSNQIGFDWKGKDPNSTPLFGTVAVSHDFGKTMNWTVKEGRDFSRDFPTDTGAIILNEAGVKLTGLDKPVGEIMKWNDKDRPIVGVVKDKVMESPYTEIKPTVFFVTYDWANVITMRIKPSVTVRDALKRIEPVFKKIQSRKSV